MEQKKWYERWNLDGSIDLVYAADADEADALFGGYGESEKEGDGLTDDVLYSTIVH